MDFNKVFNIIFIIVYVGGIVLFVVVMAKAAMDKSRGRAELKNSILKKLSSSIVLSAKDVNTMARGAGLARASVSKCLSQLLLETSDQTAFTSLQKLAADIEKTEPFEDLPAEVKPSLVRLQELIEASSQKSDAHLLSPIQRTLGTYIEQKAEFESAKRVGKWINLISIIGFIVGLWGFYFAWKSPDAKEMEFVFRKVLSAPNDQSALGSTESFESPAAIPGK